MEVFIPPLFLRLSPLITLCRTPHTILGRGGEKKKKKVGQGDLFFSHSSRQWRVAVLSSVRLEQGLMGRQGPVAKRSHSELGHSRGYVL